MRKSSKKQGYHHGNLRNALIETGMSLLHEKGDGDIGLREVARGAGVSATAVYRHFPDKYALMTALAMEGYERLADAQQQAAATKKNIADGFRASGRAYVRFALSNPALFRLMTRQLQPTSISNEQGSPNDNRAARFLFNQVSKLLPAGSSTEQIELTALQAWALVHGLATLVLNGQIPKDQDRIDSAVGEFGNWK